MTPRTLRVVIGFVVAFVLLSLAPSLPGLVADARALLAGAPDLGPGASQLLAAVDRPLSGLATDDLLLGVAALCCGLLLVRRRQAPPVIHRRPAPRPGTAVARAARPAAPLRPTERTDTLGAQIRIAARSGAGVPALARQHRLSQDAIRVAIGPAASSAGSPGSSFRPRKPLTVPASAARPSIPRRTPYRTHA